MGRRDCGFESRLPDRTCAMNLWTNTLGTIRVANRKTHSGTGFYVGRGTPLGNPFKDYGRKENIRRYREWLREQWVQGGPAKGALLSLTDMFREDRELTLVCSCAPAACHGDVIAEAILKLSERL